MLPFQLVYHPHYDLHLGPHVFPSHKFRLIRERLLSEAFADESDFTSPEPATEQDLTLVHDPGWIERLRTGTLDYIELSQLEIPYSREMVRAFWLAAGGSILAARLALRDRIGINLGGGFHHAYKGHGEGFCAINDIAVAIRKMQQEKLIERAMVVDTDVHHGNGTASIFLDDPTIFTLSIHQWNNYPSHKPPSTIDIHLPDGIEDAEYLEKLNVACRKGMRDFRPELILYVGGSDPYREDKLGGLSLSIDGLKARDRLVFDLAREHGAPVAVTLAGGYARLLDDTIAIHANTVHAAAESFQ